MTRAIALLALALGACALDASVPGMQLPGAYDACQRYEQAFIVARAKCGDTEAVARDRFEVGAGVRCDEVAIADGSIDSQCIPWVRSATCAELHTVGAPPCDGLHHL